ncbi:cell division protein [Paenibacillus sp. GCM10012307]|uniref:SRPBCC family protein n=1 Tax=Paenibacillus roseus TaxID=2798579 RepID=A0A934MXA4_9BACL|nr:SRPBCC family protein [Paenibacillus roseus]MBJ6363987.1 SRPBCC family protein [Paenibacillus roseus]
MVTIKIKTLIESRIETCFDIACDLDLHSQTVWKWTNEKVISPRIKIKKGDTVTFRAVHFLIPQNFTSKVIEYEWPFHLVDQMTKGAFKSFKHIHEFQSTGNSTIMTDTIIFEAPFGIIGKIAEAMNPLLK